MEELIPILGIFFVIGVPVMSIAARFVLRPLLLDLTAAIRGGKTEELEELKERFARIEAQLDGQDRRIDQLVEAELFRRQLEAGPTAAGPTRVEASGAGTAPPGRTTEDGPSSWK